jgi:hypothetical protein
MSNDVIGESALSSRPIDLIPRAKQQLLKIDN